MKYEVKVGIKFDGIESPGGERGPPQVQVKIPVQVQCPRARGGSGCGDPEPERPAHKAASAATWVVYAIKGSVAVLVTTLVATFAFGAATGDYSLFQQVVHPIVYAEESAVKWLNQQIDPNAK